MKDYTTDHNPKALHYAFSNKLLPEWVKEAAVPTAEDVQRLTPAAFAIRKAKLLPCHNKLATLLSAAMYHGTPGLRDAAPEAEAYIDRISRVFGVQDDVATIKEGFAQAKSASASVDEESEELCALQVQLTKEGAVHNFYTLETADDVVASADAIGKDYDTRSLPVEYYEDACKNLMKRAKAINVDLNQIPADVQDMGTERTPDFNQARVRVNGRKWAGVVTNTDLELYHDLIDSAEAEYLSLDSFKSRDSAMRKWASALLELDRVHGITQYSSRLVDPFRTLFSGVPLDEIEKMANEVVFVNEKMIPVAALAAIPEKEVQCRFNKQAAETILSWRESDDAYQTGRDISLMSESEQSELITLAVRHG